MKNRTHYTKSLIAASAICILSLGLSACGNESAEGDDVAALDEKLTGKGSDPAMKSALNEKILVDPDLAGNEMGRGFDIAGDHDGLDPSAMQPGNGIGGIGAGPVGDAEQRGGFAVDDAEHGGLAILG